MICSPCKKKQQKCDEEVEALIGLSRKDHEYRNIHNELPNGKLKPSPEDYTIWIDDDSRPWKLNAEAYSAYHQPMPLAVAFIRGHLGKYIPFLKVPNLKFISPNANGMYSEICANRYTGELVIDPKLFGTFNLCTDAPDGMKDGKLPTTGEHDTFDVVPHKEYGANYLHVAKGIPVGSLEKGPVVLAKLDV